MAPPLSSLVSSKGVMDDIGFFKNVIMFCVRLDQNYVKEWGK